MERLDHYIEHLRTFSTERDWDQFHTPENIAKPDCARLLNDDTILR